jgi:hypothetical protein
MPRRQSQLVILVLGLLPPFAGATESASLRSAVASWEVTNRDRGEAARVMEGKGFRCNATRVHVPAYIGPTPAQVTYLDCTRMLAEPRCMAQRVTLKVAADDRTVEAIISAGERACQ